MVISEAEFEAANQRMTERLEREPRAVSARYDHERGRIAIDLSTGADVSFPPDKLQGLAGATAAELAEIEISPAGFDLHFPRLDVDFTLAGLLAGAFGSRKWMAAQLGAQGGKSVSERKLQAARNNGRLGGRPKAAAKGTESDHGKGNAKRAPRSTRQASSPRNPRRSSSK